MFHRQTAEEYQAESPPFHPPQDCPEPHRRSPLVCIFVTQPNGYSALWRIEESKTKLWQALGITEQAAKRIEVSHSFDDRARAGERGSTGQAKGNWFESGQIGERLRQLRGTSGPTRKENIESVIYKFKNSPSRFYF